MESTQEAYAIEVDSTELRLAKKETALVNFDDGIVLNLPGQEQPRHLQFYCKKTGAGEGCDLRLAKRVATDSQWSDPA